MGVFGGTLGELQVHFTACVMFIVVVLTCLIKPFGKHQLLHFLEVITLAGTWLTLWAGTIFNSLPRCEDDKGVAVGWCNALSIFIGLLNIASVVAVVVGFIYYKQQKRCNACGKKLYTDVVVARRRRSTARRELQLRLRMGGVDMLDNPYDGETKESKVDGEGTVESSSNGIELTSIEAIESLEDGWTKEIDPLTGNEYLYNEEKGETKWVNEVVDESGLLNDANENPLIETNDTNDNWVKKIDSETGSEYWHNEETDETKWVEEVVGEEDGVARSENENPLIDKDIHVDPDTGRRFSVDEDTGVSEWLVE